MNPSEAADQDHIVNVQLVDVTVPRRLLHRAHEISKIVRVHFFEVGPRDRESEVNAII